MREIRGKFSSPALIHRRMNSSRNLDESSFAGRREEEERMLEWKLGGLIGERKAISRRGTFTGLENNVRSVPVVVSVGRRMRIVIRIKGDELFYTFLL